MTTLYGVLHSDKAQEVTREAKHEISARFYPGEYPHQFMAQMTANDHDILWVDVKRESADAPAVLDLRFNGQTGEIESLFVNGRNVLELLREFPL